MSHLQFHCIMFILRHAWKIFETSIWLLAESTRLLPSLGHTPRITACRSEDTPTGDSRDQAYEIMRTKCRPSTTSSYYTWPYQIVPVITAHGFLVNHSSANKERVDRKDGLYGPRYTPILEYNKLHCAAVLTVPNSINRLTINPIPDHNLDLIVLFNPSIHGYKAAPRKLDHNKNYPRFTPTR